jgi:HK97 gp10 family phage protein
VTAVRDSKGRFVGSGSGARGGATAPTRAAGKGVSVSLVGVEEVRRRLKELEPRLQKKVLRQAMRKGMKVVQRAVQANAPRPGADPYATGATRKAVKVRAVKSKRRDRIGIDVRIGAGSFVGKQFYAAFREFGTSRQPARPIMGPAYASAGPAARDLARREILAGVAREVRSLARGGR